ncbi:hypothetical protein HPB50_006815 [Hyalomma asiaticum]|uniref:Uncharacterized protein n=1 Tax=Hyalomma asiaticum TaxID=266040 RepID=A0ACB7SEN5_HYAAI|nr:hypothetical protein HPB50_006815 [Hyalomma asiaticum]
MKTQLSKVPSSQVDELMTGLPPAQQLALRAVLKASKIGEHNINFDHYRILQEVESKQQLLVAPKLTKEHVNPDNLRKMNVRLAVQVIGEFLRHVNVTEQNHIREGTVMFAPQVTTESLRVTLVSVLDLIRDLLSKGAQYVLTGKLNQDPLEEQPASSASTVLDMPKQEAHG